MRQSVLLVITNALQRQIQNAGRLLLELVPNVLVHVILGEGMVERNDTNAAPESLVIVGYFRHEVGGQHHDKLDGHVFTVFVDAAHAHGLIACHLLHDAGVDLVLAVRL